MNLREGRKEGSIRIRIRSRIFLVHEAKNRGEGGFRPCFT
jgi:hypothetical protein